MSRAGESRSLQGREDVKRAEFVQFFCGSHRGCEPGSDVTRIEWRYLGAERAIRAQIGENDGNR